MQKKLDRTYYMVLLNLACIDTASIFQFMTEFKILDVWMLKEEVTITALQCLPPLSNYMVIPAAPSLLLKRATVSVVSLTLHLLTRWYNSGQERQMTDTKTQLISDVELMWTLWKPALEFGGSRFESLLCHLFVQLLVRHNVPSSKPAPFSVKWR